MLVPSMIEPATIQAYRETHYHVSAAHSFTLQIGQTSPDLLDLFCEHGTDCAAFLTACNPLSQQVGNAENSMRQQNLETELTGLGLKFFKGVGRHPSNNWPGEDSFLVMGLRLENARALGNRFEQSAIVWADKDGEPQLVLLR